MGGVTDSALARPHMRTRSAATCAPHPSDSTLGVLTYGYSRVARGVLYAYSYGTGNHPRAAPAWQQRGCAGFGAAVMLSIRAACAGAACRCDQRRRRCRTGTPLCLSVPVVGCRRWAPGHGGLCARWRCSSRRWSRSTTRSTPNGACAKPVPPGVPPEYPSIIPQRTPQRTPEYR